MAELGSHLQGPLTALEAAGNTSDARAVRAAQAAVGASLAALSSLPDGGAAFFFEAPLELARRRVTMAQMYARLMGTFRAETIDRAELFLLHEQLAVALLATTDLQRAHAERRRREEGLPPPPWARCRPVHPFPSPEDPMLLEVAAEDVERIPPRLARSAQRALLWAVACSGVFGLLDLTPGCVSVSPVAGSDYHPPTFHLKSTALAEITVPPASTRGTSSHRAGKTARMVSRRFRDRWLTSACQRWSLVRRSTHGASEAQRPL